MFEVLLPVLSIMGYLGIILGLLVLINTVCGVIKNTSAGQAFSWKIFFKGILKAVVFYVCTVLLSVAFTMLPEVNTMITENAGVELFAQETLTTLSNVAVFAIVVGAVVAQGKSALEGVTELLSVKVAGQIKAAAADKDNEGRD